ncbi:sugar-phosphatase [Clostridium sp. YIM B02551]|uniref:sugar-phosphatase n=1 Tax=Clostridium sp. YIM B02551 TaxID=2910679 RepID=UPI001EEA46F7|nr:sugar-phosphatase [Clostridium sp. YIM B02551]
MYKIIAIDMDGTLLREDKTVSDRTKEAIKKAKELGVKVVLASGRPIEGIDQYLKELNLISEKDYVLSYNGALVLNTETRDVISSSLLYGKDVHKLYDISKKLGVNIHAFSRKNGLITPKNSTYTEVEAKINGIEINIMPFENVAADEEIVKIMMIDEPDILSDAIKKLPKELYEKYTVVQSTPYFLEFLNKDSNKGTGIEALAAHLGISKEEVICVGDAGNDHHMIEYAGLGVAMGNATNEIKDIASYVTKSNEEDGVAEVIEKFIVK